MPKLRMCLTVKSSAQLLSRSWRNGGMVLLYGFHPSSPVTMASDPSNIASEEGRRDMNILSLAWYCYKMLSMFLTLAGDIVSNRNFPGFSQGPPITCIGGA